jgi:hypothetical protein
MRNLLTSRSFSIAAVLSLLSLSAAAQPDVRDHRRKGPVVRDQRAPEPPPAPPPPVTGRPRQAPPPPRAEKVETRAGYVWVAGRWDWKNGAWAWVPGRWERARANRSWRDGRWEDRGGEWYWVDGAWVDASAAPPPPVTPPPPAVTPPPPVTVTSPGVVVSGPREAPPSPREEKIAARAGYVWVAGRWDWRNGKWEWLPGRWERERAGKQWRNGRWDRQGEVWVWVDGQWIDAGAVAVAPPPPPPPVVAPPPDRRGPRVWKLERPMISSYWPVKGKAGTRVVINGKNLPTTAAVVWNGQPVRGARVKPNQVVLTVPANAASGVIGLRMDRARDLTVGAFEVVPDFDPEAERRRIEEERRRAAEAAWAARQAKLAQDRAAREAAARAYEAQLAASREQRRLEKLAALQARWQRAFLSDPDTQAELTLHAQRMADLGRMLSLAELSANGKLAVRIEIAQARERDRHDQRMAALQAPFTMNK